VICAQGPAPAGATIDHYRAEGLKVIPGDGLLATVIPGAWDGWMLMLRDYGRLPLRDVLEPAIWYAEQGPSGAAARGRDHRGAGRFLPHEWPTSL
jgi:gamma-glutamyltranspeptidase / glutathione hydrolase